MPSFGRLGFLDPADLLQRDSQRPWLITLIGATLEPRDADRLGRMLID